MDKPDNRIYLCLAHMSEDGIEQKYIKKAFDDNYVVPLGPNVNQFEAELEAFVGESKRVVALYLEPEPFGISDTKEQLMSYVKGINNDKLSKVMHLSPTLAMR